METSSFANDVEQNLRDSYESYTPQQLEQKAQQLRNRMLSIDDQMTELHNERERVDREYHVVVNLWVEKHNGDNGQH